MKLYPFLADYGLLDRAIRLGGFAQDNDILKQLRMSSRTGFQQRRGDKNICSEARTVFSECFTDARKLWASQLRSLLNKYMIRRNDFINAVLKHASIMQLTNLVMNYPGDIPFHKRQKLARVSDQEIKKKKKLLFIYVFFFRLFQGHPEPL